MKKSTILKQKRKKIYPRCPITVSYTHLDVYKRQVYAGYKIFVAEVASTCNEALLIRHLLNRTEETQEKRYLCLLYTSGARVDGAQLQDAAVCGGETA